MTARIRKMLCKYLSPEGAKASLSARTSIPLRFSLPKEYNDPYELYLEPGDFNTSSERAYFDHYLGDLAQVPVSCFSHSPDSMVMWAHYSRDRQGACLLFDEDALCNSFDSVLVDDVKYAQTYPSEHLRSIAYARITGKGRHMRFAMAESYSTAYFTKADSWSYEHERRLLVNRDQLRSRKGMLLGHIRPRALRAILVGNKADPSLLALCVRRGSQLSVPVLQLRCSRRVSKPLFLDLSKRRFFAWDTSKLVAWGAACIACGDPLVPNHPKARPSTCAWCKITRTEKRDAAVSNLLGAVWMYGIEEPTISFAWGERKGRKQKDRSGGVPPSHEGPGIATLSNPLPTQPSAGPSRQVPADVADRRLLRR